MVTPWCVCIRDRRMPLMPRYVLSPHPPKQSTSGAVPCRSAWVAGRELGEGVAVEQRPTAPWHTDGRRMSPQFSSSLHGCCKAPSTWTLAMGHGRPDGWKEKKIHRSRLSLVAFMVHVLLDHVLPPLYLPQPFLLQV